MTLIKSFESFKSRSEELIFVANPDAVSLVENFLTESEEFFQGDVQKAIEVLEENGFSAPKDFTVVALNEALGAVRYEGHESKPDGIEIFVTVNGHKYGYKQKEGGLDISDVARKFEKMLQFSAGKALNWLKRNTIPSSGSKSAEATDSKTVKENHEHMDKDADATETTEAPSTSSKDYNHEMKRYMFFSNLKVIKSCIEKIMEHDPEQIDSMIDNGHDWAEDHIATSKDDIQEVCDWICTHIDKN